LHVAEKIRELLFDGLGHVTQDEFFARRILVIGGQKFRVAYIRYPKPCNIPEEVFITSQGKQVGFGLDDVLTRGRHLDEHGAVAHDGTRWWRWNEVRNSSLEEQWTRLGREWLPLVLGRLMHLQERKALHGAQS
jgi:hypothetical protein